MFPSKGCYKRVHKIHKTSLRLVLKDYESSFKSLLSILNEKAIHQCCIRAIPKNCDILGYRYLKFG